MAIEPSDMNDSQILQTTVQETGEDGKVRYKTVLPSGRDLVSEWMDPGQMKGKIVIKWCELVREQVGVDAAEERAAKKRETIDLPATKSSTQEVTEEDTPQTALDFATKSRDNALMEVEEAELTVETWKQKRKNARTEYENWSKIVDSLRGETDE